MHLRIDTAQIKPTEDQSTKAGGNGVVEKATLVSAQPLSSPESECSEFVAVKKLRLETEIEKIRGLALFANEVSLLNDLSHPSVVRILGFVEDVDNHVAWIVFCWEKNGNLREFIRSENWELPERVSLIDDVARGLSYLHGRSPPICHGDLKSLNILVNSKHLAVITDFGSARSIDSKTEKVVNNARESKTTDSQQQTQAGLNAAGQLTAAMSGEFITITGPAWTFQWAAPELLHGEIPGLGSDVWAFGWICWEAFTGNFPFDGENPVATILRVLNMDLPAVRDKTQVNRIQTLCGLMEECWSFPANKRPTALRCQQVVSFMDQTIPRFKGGNSSAIARSSGLWNALGQIKLRNGAVDEAQEYFRQSLEVCESVGDEEGKARATSAIGDVYYRQTEYSKAEESYMESRNLYIKIGDQIGLANSVRALGDVYRMRSEYPKAEESYIQSRDIYSKIGDQLG
ncbi:hypothetical protein FS837_000982, partial [Tulasnella sp. UAMH 9824]